jgi:hypothetical protein
VAKARVVLAGFLLAGFLLTGFVLSGPTVAAVWAGAPSDTVTSEAVVRSSDPPNDNAQSGGDPTDNLAGLPTTGPNVVGLLMLAALLVLGGMAVRMAAREPLPLPPAPGRVPGTG